ncbi:hypothetical protein Q8G47_28070, partial [Klebsiella pneumoniae]|uniref:hypothetical protein n=1 Tax=Klebsiella pneumoniae TaxID=573 RepID=UPI0030141C07
QQQQQTTGTDGGIAALSSAIDHRRAQVIELARRQGGGEVDVARWMEEEREKWREGKIEVLRRVHGRGTDGRLVALPLLVLVRSVPRCTR